MWPDHESERDLLGVQHLVCSAVDIVNSDNLLPATIGVFGDWGSGKSSVIQMIERDLKSQGDVILLSFNGWLFEGYDDAKTALMETIIDEISSQKTLGNRAKVLAVNLIRKVNWFRAVGSAVKYGAATIAGGPVGLSAVAGIDAVALAKKAGEKIEDLKPEDVSALLEDEKKHTLRKGIREFRENFESFLNEAKIKKLVVVIDDLDRCLPDTIIETLEAIKLFLFVPGSAFIIGADERLVRFAVRSRFPELPGDRTDVGRDYLEKLIQYMIRVPLMSKTDTENYIALLFSLPHLSDGDLEKVCEWALGPKSIQEGRSFGLSSASEVLEEVPEPLKEELALAERISPILADVMNGNPRQCKRFLNTLMMRLKMAASREVEIQQRVLAKLMILEYLRPETFKKLAGWQISQNGVPPQIVCLEDALAQPGIGKEAEKKDAERNAGTTPKSNADKIKMDTELGVLFAEDWFKEWLTLEPKLAGIDLRPYFYFSRDSLSTLSYTAKRLSSAAREILLKILSPSEAVREGALKLGEDVSPVDAASIFEELAEKAKHSEDHSKEESPLLMIVEWTGVRHELLGELLTFLPSFPAQALPPQIILKLEGTCKAAGRQELYERYIEQVIASDSESSIAKVAIARRKRKKG
ncbi:P-loop NTPase fold protein [Pontiellaceae bacterium B12227]|nr:P-loop NTPase fold protein [Pontiellaceae bacterium B12227]